MRQCDREDILKRDKQTPSLKKGNLGKEVSKNWPGNKKGWRVGCCNTFWLLVAVTKSLRKTNL